jgi:hypothetical protein
VSVWRRVYEDRRSVALPLLVALIANLAVWMLLVLPLRTSLASAESDARDADVDLVNARRLGERATEVSESRGHADTQLGEFYGRILPQNFAVAVKTTNAWLQQAARDAGLEFRQSHFEYEPIDDSRLIRAFSTVSLIGDYPAIRRFLHAVETAEEFIVLERVELMEGSSGSGGGGIGIEVTVSTYFVAAGQR